MTLLDFLFPKRCVGCGRIGSYVCVACAVMMERVKSNEAICPMCQRRAHGGVTHPGCKRAYAIDGLTSFFRYKGVVRKAIKTLKYRLVSDLAWELMSHISLSAVSADMLIPIPLHRERIRNRGFNQAEVLGSLLAARLNIPVQNDILCRTRHTHPQAGIQQKEERLSNMKNAFLIKKGSHGIRGLRIILFDDVVTTGATLRAAASVLKRAGAKSVWAITLAR